MSTRLRSAEESKALVALELKQVQEMQKQSQESNTIMALELKKTQETVRELRRDLLTAYHQLSSSLDPVASAVVRSQWVSCRGTWLVVFDGHVARERRIVCAWDPRRFLVVVNRPFLAPMC
jgi:hypothetical protein